MDAGHGLIIVHATVKLDNANVRRSLASLLLLILLPVLDLAVEESQGYSDPSGQSVCQTAAIDAIAVRAGETKSFARKPSDFAIARLIGTDCDVPVLALGQGRCRTLAATERISDTRAGEIFCARAPPGA